MTARDGRGSIVGRREGWNAHSRGGADGLRSDHRPLLDLLTKASPSQLESLRAGGADHARSLRRIVDSKNVVAVGISEKISKKKPTGTLAVTFYVEKKIPMKKLRADRMIPPTMPETLSGPEAVPTDVVAIGRLRLEVNAIRTPVQPGNSIGHVDISAGTLGALVTRGGDVHILSNSHVLARSGRAKNGDDILYPGDADGGKLPADLVAKLSGFKKFVTGGDFVNRADCAIAKPLTARRGDLVSAIKGLGVPKGATVPVRGMKVVKVGRTTNKTTGTVRDVHFRFALDYDDLGKSVGFLDQVFCTRYSKPGDSGSLVLSQANKKAVGLHFAGADGGSVFSPIQTVLSTLGVTLVTTSIGSPQRARRAGRARPRRRARPGG